MHVISFVKFRLILSIVLFLYYPVILNVFLQNVWLWGYCMTSLPQKWILYFKKTQLDVHKHNTFWRPYKLTCLSDHWRHMDTFGGIGHVPERYICTFNSSIKLNCHFNLLNINILLYKVMSILKCLFVVVPRILS